MALEILIILWLIPTLICMGIASSKNRSAINWFFLSILFGWFALIAIIFMDDNISDEEKNIDLEIKDIDLEIKKEQLMQLKKKRGAKK